MKTNKLTITESIIGYLIDLYVRKAGTDKTEKSSKFHPEVMSMGRW
jgi:hypothetical protein